MAKQRAENDGQYDQADRPWAAKIEEDPDVYGSKSGKRVFEVCMNGQKKIAPKLIRADNREQAIDWYKGDGIIATRNQFLAVDVTDSYLTQTKELPAPAHPQAAAAAFGG